MAASIFTAMASAAGGKIAVEVAASLMHGSKTERDTVKERLDPISLLAIIALMKFQLPDTKVHIGDHDVTVSHSSDYTYFLNFRSVARTYSGDSHEDLALIKSAIKTAAFWHALHSEDNVEIREFMDHVSEGLDALMTTYAAKHPMACDALEYYKLHIQIYKAQAPTDVEVPNEVTQRVKDLWDKRQIADLNSDLRAMASKQGSTPVTTKILCQDEIIVYRSRIEAKAVVVKSIYNK